MGKFEIPKGKRKAPSTEPKSMLIYSAIKQGKTTVVADLIDSLLIEHEVAGADAVDARVIELRNPYDLPELFETVKQDDTVKYLIIDTVTYWDEMSEIIGTYNYMGKPQGKKMNVGAGGVKLQHTDPAFETVHEMPNGYGYRYSREAMVTWFKAAIATGKTVIFLAHIKDKFIESKSGDVVEASDINLTGKVKAIFTANVDAVAVFKREGDKGYLVFENMGSTIAGSRYPHLHGKILISESDENRVVTTFWERVFPSINK